MTEPPKPTGPRYLCPTCKLWRGEHFKTGLLSRHRAPGGTPYDLCRDSLRTLAGLPARHGDRDLPPRYTAPYRQPPLFREL